MKKLLLTGTVYGIWNERNKIAFLNTGKQPKQLLGDVFADVWRK